MQALSRAQLLQTIRLLDRKGRQEQGCFLVEGEKLVEEAVRSGLEVERLVLTEQFLKRHASWLAGLGVEEGRCFTVSPAGMARLSDVSTPPELLAVVRRPQSSLEGVARHPFILCAPDLADPGNLGTIIRTADWFGAGAVLLGPHAVDPYGGKAVRASMGSLFHLAVHQSQDLLADLQRLREEGVCLLATAVRAQAEDLPPRLPLCLLLGSESHGLDRQYRALADRLYSIPGRGRAESLNVAVSAAIILYQCSLAYGNLS